MTAIFESILTTVESQIQGLSLTGVNSTDVNVRDELDFLLQTPNVQITTPRPEIMRKDDGTNTKDDVVYPVLVTTVDADGHNQTRNFNRYLTWRKSISDSFRHQPLSGVSGISTCHVEPIDVVDEKKWLSDRGLMVGALLLLFSSREARG